MWCAICTRPQGWPGAGCQITDPSPLTALTSLTSLNLSHNAIQDVTPLKSLAQRAVILAQHQATPDYPGVFGVEYSVSPIVGFGQNPLTWSESGTQELTAFFSPGQSAFRWVSPYGFGGQRSVIVWEDSYTTSAGTSQFSGEWW